VSSKILSTVKLLTQILIFVELINEGIKSSQSEETFFELSYAMSETLKTRDESAGQKKMTNYGECGGIS
jgi:hypothetical protein